MYIYIYACTHTHTHIYIYLSCDCSSVKDLESDDDLLKQQPARIASAVVDRSKQPPASFDHTKKKQAGTSQPAKRETMPVAKSGKAEPNRNDDSDWDEIR